MKKGKTKRESGAREVEGSWKEASHSEGAAIQLSVLGVVFVVFLCRGEVKQGTKICASGQSRLGWCRKG